MNHEKEIDRLGVEYSAGIEDFKDYATRLISMEPEEIAHIFYSDTARVVDDDDPELCWKVLTEFSARGIIDTLDSYDMKLEQKATAISKLLRPGNVVYLHNSYYMGADITHPVLILGWRDYYDKMDFSFFNKLDADKIIITYYDLVSQLILDEEMIRINDISKADFVYGDISDLVVKFMNALKAQSDNYFKKKDDEERRKFDLPEGYRLKKPENAKRSGRYNWEEIEKTRDISYWWEKLPDDLLPEEDDD